MSKTAVRKVFALTDKKINGFLAKHPEIRTLRPKTQKGKPHPRRLKVHIVNFVKAIRHDDYFADNPLVQQKIQRNLDRAAINKTLLDACTALLVPGQQQPRK